MRGQPLPADIPDDALNQRLHLGGFIFQDGQFERLQQFGEIRNRAGRGYLDFLKGENSGSAAEPKLLHRPQRLQIGNVRPVGTAGFRRTADSDEGLLPYVGLERVLQLRQMPFRRNIRFMRADQDDFVMIHTFEKVSPHPFGQLGLPGFAKFKHPVRLPAPLGFAGEDGYG
ncbi:hypothetical protein D1872_269570 [compost metagenome]